MTTETKTNEPVKLCEADDPEWLELRDCGIGASESPAACGVSEYSTPREIYHRKRGELPPVQENRAMRFGNHNEPFALAEFEIETGIKSSVYRPGLYCSGRDPWILATPDSIIDDEALIEVKTINERQAERLLGEPWTDEIPWGWNVQAQQQMYVMNRNLVWFAVLVGNSDVRAYQIHRHEIVMERIVGRVTDLWKRIKAGDPPPIQEGHRSNYQMAKALFGEIEEGEIVHIDDEIVDHWLSYEEKTKFANKQKKEADNHKAAVMLALGNAQAGKLPDGRFVRRKLIQRSGYEVKPCEYIDVKAVKKL